MIKVSGTKTVIVIIGFYLVVFLNHLHACHESHFNGEELLVGTSFFGGHTGDNKIGRAVSVRENFQKLAGNIIESITITSYYVSDTFATTTNCNWRTAGILNFFHESHQFIAEDSAVGSGEYLQALASLTGCNSKQYSNFQKVMHREYGNIFTDNDYNRSVKIFFSVINTNVNLLECRSNS